MELLKSLTRYTDKGPVGRRLMDTLRLTFAFASIFVAGCGSIVGGVTSQGLMTLNITSHPNLLTASTAASMAFQATGNPGNSYQCQIDAGSFSACTSPTNYSGLAAGAHTFSVKYADNSGNASNVASFSWSVVTCGGGYTAFTAQQGAGVFNTAAGIVHNACNTVVAGTNLINGNNFISGATEYGAGGNPSTSVVVTQYNFVGEINWTSEYAMTNAIANVSGIVQDAGGNLYVAGWVMCKAGQTCNFGGAVHGTTGLGLNGNSDAFLMKFNSSGVFQWVKQLGGGTLATHNVSSITALSLAIDGANNLYMAGGTMNTLGGVQTNGLGTEDAWVAKYTSAGAFSWVSEMGNNGNSIYIANGVTIDSGGNVDVSGSAQWALLNNQLSVYHHGFNDIFVMQLNPATGAHNWDYQLGNGGNLWGNALQTDSSNNLYVAGYTDGLLTSMSGTQYGVHGNKDVFISKFNSAGNYVSSSQFGALGASMTLGALGGNSITQDSAGNFYILGQVDSYAGGGCYSSCNGPSDAFVMKMSSTMTFGWVSQMGSTGSGGTNYFGMSTDTNGNSYIATVTNANLGLEYGTHSVDSLTTTISNLGVLNLSTASPVVSANPLWPIQTGVAGSGTLGNGVALDSSGNYYVAGLTSGVIAGSTQIGVHGANDATLTKYDSLGNQLWTNQVGSAGATIIGRGIIADSFSNLYTVGETSAVIGTQSGTHGSKDLFVSSWSSSGANNWTIQYGKAGSSVAGFAIAQDNSGEFFIAGNTSAYLGGIQTGTLGNTDVFLVKFDSSHVFQFANQIGAAGQTTTSSGMIFDGTGNFYISGSTTGDLGGTQLGTHGGSDLFIAKFTSAGAFVWVVQYGLGGKNTIGGGLTLDGSGNIVVTGYTNGVLAGSTQYGQHGSKDIVVASLTPAGALNWVDQLGAYSPCSGGESCNGMRTASSFGISMTKDSSGLLYVLGASDGMVPNATQYRSHANYNNGNNTDVLIAQFTSAGAYNWTSQMGLTAKDSYGAGIIPASGAGRSVTAVGYTNGSLGGTINGAIGTNSILLFNASSSGVLP